MAEAATSPGRRASVDSAFSDYQVELIKVENSLESALALSNSHEQQQRNDELFLDDHLSIALASADSALDGCSGSSAALWQGGLRLVIEAPIAKVWEISSDRCGICRWMPMIEDCEELDPGDADKGGMGSRRLIRGDILPRIDNIQSWAIEKLVEFDAENHYYTYVVEESNIGLEGYRATLQLNDFGDNTTLVNWIYEVRAMEDTTEEGMADYMGMFFKACIRRLELLASSKEKGDDTCNGLIGPIGT